MKILVTVGTTKFDSLIEYIDVNGQFNGIDIEFQTANGGYIPVNHPYFSFVDSNAIIEKYAGADIIITHAGQGTIIRLLEMRKKFIVVPNLERVDKHQLDIADFLSKNKYAFVAYSFSQLDMFVDICRDYRFREYSKENFFKAGEILSYML
jgi:beta-1,4-N-acetylglucosaminyltransferase